MAISYVGSTIFESASTTTTTVTITRPDAVQVGDLILAVAAGSTSSAPAVPAGWAAWEPTVAYGPGMTVLYRFAAADDPASWSWPVASAKWSGVTVAWRGVDTTTPKDVPSVSATATSVAFPATPAITTATANALIVAFGGTVGASGDLNIDWTSDGTIHAEATSQAAATTNSACVATSRPAPTAGTYTPSVAAVEAVTRGGVLVSALRAAPPLSAPTVNAGADATANTGSAFTRTATESDGGSPITARSWSIVSGPAGAGSSIGSAAALSWTPTVAGTYVLRYSATNGVGTATDDVTVTVTAQVDSVSDWSTVATATTPAYLSVAPGFTTVPELVGTSTPALQPPGTTTVNTTQL